MLATAPLRPIWQSHRAGIRVEIVHEREIVALDRQARNRARRLAECGRDIRGMESAEHGRAVEVAREIAPRGRAGVELAGEVE